MMAVGRQFGIAEIHRHPVLRRTLEQRPGRRVRHLALEPGVDLGLILHVPARKERRQRQLRIDDEVGAVRLGLVHQREHALDHGLPAVGLWIGPIWAAATLTTRMNGLSGCFHFAMHWPKMEQIVL